MSNAGSLTVEADRVRNTSDSRHTFHCVIAGLVLLTATGWWLFAKNVLQWALRKEPVPWPALVTVGADFRLMSLPSVIGSFVRARDGELTGGKKDGTPDGENIVQDNVLETLGVGTKWDKGRRKQRCSNWYVSRVYRDARVRERNGPYRYWELHVTYYTGAMDTVPHVPGVCLQQAGASILGITEVDFNVPTARDGWNKRFKVNRTRYERQNPGRLERFVHSQYSVFSLNGLPEHDWKKVRLELTNPLVRHSYFASIQFSPKYPVKDLDECDKKAEEFLNIVLPRVLEALPTREDVERCSSEK